MFRKIMTMLSRKTVTILASVLLIIGFAFACFISSPQVHAAEAATSCLEIGYGSGGSVVQILQYRLDVYSNAGLIPDGLFGPKTLTAVENFQKAHLSQVRWVDGIVGPLTWGALGGCGPLIPPKVI
jgi:Putative peptidoglycan binding domain